MPSEDSITLDQNNKFLSSIFSSVIGQAVIEKETLLSFDNRAE